MVATREEAIQQFDKEARDDMALLALIEALPEDAVLGCWCRPEACHGDAIMQIWKELHSGV